MSAFQNEVSNHDVTLAVVADDDREQLAQASQLTEALRRQDPSYQSELRWWTSPFNLDEECKRRRDCRRRKPAALTLPVHFRHSGTAIGGGRSTSTTRRSLCCVRAATAALPCCGVGRHCRPYFWSVRMPVWRRAP